MSPGWPAPKVDGLLLVSLVPSDEEVEAIRDSGVATVLLDARHRELPCVFTDDVAGGELATRHLIELGHEQIAFIGDAPEPGFGFSSTDRRAEGYRTALREAGIPPRRTLRGVAPHGRAAAHRLARELFHLRRPPTAVFAASDIQALGVLEAATAEGLAVPDDLSVIGYDDIDVARYVGLTTVDQSLRESGRRGVERLLGALDGCGWGPLHEQLPLELKVRRTTGAPR